jgi:UDPglucose 6-dehydrogenase/GDP-mannose 6-dehydrogenase
MRISIIGTGYVGLITGVSFALRGNEVVCVDLDPEVVRQINEGRATIHEAGLPEALTGLRGSQCFRATTDLREAVDSSDISIIAVGTPDRGGRIDLRFVRRAAADLGRLLRRKKAFHTVIVKSTVLPGTTDSVVLPLLESSSKKRLGAFGLGFVPEFLREGTAMEDAVDPDRIVLGADDARSARVLRRLFDGWKSDIVEVNTRTAEMIKYANNCFIATQISTANELANLAAGLHGVDIAQVMPAVHLDRRWSPIIKEGTRIRPEILAYLWPGCGFGGSCFPKDLKALIAHGRSLGQPMWVLDAVLKTNTRQPLQVVKMLNESLGTLRGKKIAVLGLAFKPGTDDIRESPAIPLIRELVRRRCVVSAADPVAHVNAGRKLAGLPVRIHSDWRKAVRGAHAAAMVTAWPEYRAISAPELKRLMRGRLVVDGRGMCGHLEASKLFEVRRIGYKPTRTTH